MSTYLVTGCAGFIGSKVAELLMADGHSVTGVDNLNDAYDLRLKKWRLSRLEGQPGFAFHHMDICDRDAMRRVFGGGVDGVVNLAARSGVRPSVENPWVYFETNVTGTLSILEMCREFGVGKLVIASTSSLYGASNGRPSPEDANTDRSLSPYSASKKAAESLCYTYHHLHGLDVTVLRYFTVYGPAGRPDMSLFRFVQWVSEDRPVTVYGDGSQTRDFTYVDDVARGTVEGLKPMGYQVINLGSDHPVVLMDTIHLVEKWVDKKAKLEHRPSHPADVPATWANIGKARELLGWEPRVDIDEGVGRLVSWYQDNRAWARHVNTY